MKKEDITKKTVELIRKIFFLDFIKGLRVTLSYSLSRSVTERYPDEEKWVPYRRFRGVHRLWRDEQGRELCVACELCSGICPTDCITVIPMEDDTGRGITDRVPRVWDVDLSRCLFCGYCEDACPTRAVRLGREYEVASEDLQSAILHVDELLVPQPVPESLEGGVLAKSRFIRDNGAIRVAADLNRTWKRKL
ncbi:MAG: NADH-quinone oxidoreductase subunit I [Desulfobacteraceae bacterium]|nr:MAG: NADH-quinone oxidoreductase subunit I [Desulfobacteraceae bacterium]